MPSSFEPEFENGVPVFRPAYDDFIDFRQFVNKIEPIGMTTGIVKVIPPPEWIADLPKLTTAQIDQIDIRNPIAQNITINGGRGVFSVDNFEKRKKYSIKQWVKQCNMLSNQPPTKRGERQRVLGKYEAPQGGFVSYDDSDFTPDVLADLEQKFWKGISYGGSPMYGADLPGSLFSPTTKDWNVAKLDSLLSVLEEKVPGVNDAYLYCGMWKAVFSWHLEDVDLPSINYIHFGAPKQWYSIPQSHHEQFYALMSALWPEEQEKCSEFLRHKTFLVDPMFIEKQGIPVNKIVHRQQEFMITFPYGYHAGFNYGFNIAESVNFAHDSWLDIGSKASKCQCVSHSVGINVQQLVDSFRSTAAEERSREADKKDMIAASFADHRVGNCVSCPHIFNNQYVANKAGTAETHITCANLTPETWIANDTVYGLDSIQLERFKSKCGHCKSSLGCCFQCSSPKCARAYHGSCASAAGVDYHDPHRPLCRYHRSKSNSMRKSRLLPNDVIQYKVDGRFGSGLVSKVTENAVEVTSLPNPASSYVINPADVVDVFVEYKCGPYIEPLQPIRKRKRDKTEADDETVNKKPSVQLSSPPPQSKPTNILMTEQV